MHKRAKNSAFFSLALLFGWLVAGVFYAQSAHAADPISVPIYSHPVTTGAYNNNAGVYSLYPAVVGNGMICPIEQTDWLSNKAKWGLAKRIVTCVKGVVIPATMIMLNSYFVYFYNTIIAACTLAIVIWGYMMVTGKHSAPVRDAFITALKIGAVIMFTYVFGKSTAFPDGLYPVLLSVVDDMISKVSSYAYYSTQLPCAVNVAFGDMWALVDCMLETLVGGIITPSGLARGFLGILVAAFFSGPFGLFVAAAGFAIILILFYAVIRAVYIVITAYIAISLMAIVSPIFISCILFAATRAYFEKWLKLLIGFMLQPIFMFAYISMLLVAYDVVVYKGPFSVYRAIAGSAVDRPHFNIGDWMRSSVYVQSASSVGVGVDPRRDSTLADHNVGTLGTIAEKPLDPEIYKNVKASGIVDMFSGLNVYKVDVPTWVIRWESLATRSGRECKQPCNATNREQRLLGYMVDVFLALLLAALTVYLFYLLLDLLPFIGAGISGETLSMPVLGKGKLGMPGNSWISKLKSSTMGATGGGGGT